MNVRQSKGFTLVEMIIVVVVTGILLAIAVPNFMDMLRNTRLSGMSSDMVADLALARAEAAKRGRAVSICISSTGTSCATTTNWAVGRIIFSDSSTAGSVDAGDEVVRVNLNLLGTITVTSSGFSNTKYMQYRADGTPDSAGSFKFCDNRTGNFGRVISVSVTGRVSSQSAQACP